jgi:hypothetical protein
MDATESRTFRALLRRGMRRWGKGIAAKLGKGYSTLMNELSGQRGYKLSVETAIKIMRETKNYSALEYLAALTGRVALPLEKRGAGAKVKLFGGLLHIRWRRAARHQREEAA